VSNIGIVSLPIFYSLPRLSTIRGRGQRPQGFSSRGNMDWKERFCWAMALCPPLSFHIHWFDGVDIDTPRNFLIRKIPKEKIFPAWERAINCIRRAVKCQSCWIIYCM
jgi:hypothetical protein